MTKFKFQLEPVLQYRETKEQRAAMAQSSAYREYLSCVQCLEKTKIDMENSLHNDETETNYFDALNTLMYREFLKKKVIEEQKTVDRAWQRFEKCRQKTIEARKQKLILEKLKQSRLNRYIQQFKKTEQKHIDELAAQISLRKQPNNYHGL